MKHIYIMCAALLSVAACAGMRPLVADFHDMDTNGDLVLTKDEVVPVYGEKEWRKMDIDGSGTVKQFEFHRYPNQHLGE